MDKLLYDPTVVGTTKQNEWGMEADDSRGGSGNTSFTKLYPQTASGGGQSAVTTTYAYRPGNRYKYVLANGSIPLYGACKYDVTFATALNRDKVVIATTTSTAGVNPLAGINEMCGRAVIATEYFFMTTRGLAIALVGTVAAGDKVVAKTTAGTLNTLDPGAAYVQAEAQQTMQAASGLGAVALSATNTPITGTAYVQLT